MKYNIKYYKEELDNKKIPEEYNEILEKIEKCEGRDFSKTLDNHSKIKNVLALSEIRENILNWYEFKEGSSVLEMNANYGELTSLLCKKCKKVTSIEASLKKSEIIKLRHEDKKNLEIIVGDLKQIKIRNKFDYIVIVDAKDKIEEYLEYAKKHLNDSGIIIIAVNNKFGIKSWITTKEDGKVTANNKTTISKNKLEELLNNMQYRFYYPLPDYKMPNIIYTDKSLPTLSNIYRDLTYKDESVNLKEVDAYAEIIKNDRNDFIKFANSFIVEVSKEKLENNKIKFITFSNIRKDEYRIKTIIKDKKVYKTAINEKANGHINQIKNNIDLLNNIKINTLDSYKDDEIISQFVDGNTLEDELLKTYIEKGKEEFFNQIEQYYEFLKEKLIITDMNLLTKNVFDKYKIEVNDKDMEKLIFVKHGFWDLIFQNCFMIDNKYYFYDQEWYEENIPAEYILYRAILYFGQIKKYISDDEIFERFELKNYINIFKQLDDKIQRKIRKALMWNIHTKDELIKNKVNKLQEEINKKDIEIEKLKSDNNEKNNEIAIIKDSLSWKITKPLRFIRKGMKK